MCIKIEYQYPQIHELKILPEYFAEVATRNKLFEIRKNDRDYQVGDVVFLWEYSEGKCTGNSISCVITFITDYEQKENYVVFGIAVGSVDMKEDSE